MEIFTLLLLTIGVSMDTFIVSLANGLSFKDLNIKYTMLFCFCLAIFQSIMPIIGAMIGGILANSLEILAPFISFGIFTFLGVSMIIDAKKSQDEINSSQKLNNITIKYILMIAIATSIDAMSVGFGISFYGYNILLIAFCFGIGTLIFSFIGLKLGSKLKRFASKANIIGGIILLLLGIKFLLQGLI